MNSSLEKVLKACREPGKLASDLTKSGMASLETLLEGRKILGSLLVFTKGSTERDETHYFLVPCEAEKFVVYTKRVLPEGEGALNSLPKVRLFHVPDPAGIEFIEQWLFQTTQDKEMIAVGSDLADRLEAFGKAVDSEAKNVSGGLLLIGGAVAFLNPLAGAAVALHALLPSLSSTALKNGIEFTGSKLRNAAQQKEAKRSAKAAKAEVKRCKPEIVENPILASISLTFSSPGFDPFLESSEEVLSRMEMERVLTCEAIREVFQREYPKTDRSFWESPPGRWVSHLIELGEVK